MTSDTASAPARPDRSVTPSLHLPLRRLALCLDCEACYELGASACPACGGESWASLAKFLDEAPVRVVPQFRPLPKYRGEPPRHREDAKVQVTRQQLIVVARDQQRLCEYLRRA